MKKGALYIVLVIVGLALFVFFAVLPKQYATQMQGARDAVRISNIQIMETSLHQYYADNAEYPEFVGISDFQEKLRIYNSNFSSDPKSETTEIFGR